VMSVQGTSAAATIPVRVATERGHRFWLCPNCGAKLGMVLGTRVIIQIGERQVRMPVSNEPEQDCPKCGQASLLFSGGYDGPEAK